MTKTSEEKLKDLQDEVSYLQDKVSYLESMTGYNYEDDKFRRTAAYIFKIDRADVEITGNPNLGGFSASAPVQATRLGEITDSIERRDGYTWSVHGVAEDGERVILGLYYDPFLA